MVKHFARFKQRAALRKLFSLPPNHPHHIKSYFVSGTKLFLRRYTEIYRYLLSKRFKNPVLGCQEIVHCNFFFFFFFFFCDSIHKHICWKMGWVYCGIILFSMPSKLGFITWVKLFEQNCIVKWVTFFASFCCLWDFMLRNLKLKKTPDVVHRNGWMDIKKLYARNNIFKKRIPKYKTLNRLYFGPNFIFWRSALGCFSQCFFLTFCRRPNMVADIFTQSPHPHPLPPP